MTEELKKQLESTTKELKNSLNEQRKNIASMDMSEQSKQTLLSHIGEIESSIANGSMAQITELIKNISK